MKNSKTRFLKGRIPHNKGKVGIYEHSKKTLRKMKKNHKGMLGKYHSKKAKNKMAKSQKERFQNKEERKKISKKLKKLVVKWKRQSIGRNENMFHFKKGEKINSCIKKLDVVFSQYIRNKYAVNGFVNCFTCYRLFLAKDMDCGHYISRMYKSLRYSEKNAHPQCRYCNRYLFGAMDEYAIHLQKEYGKDILNELNKKKREIKQFTVPELNKMIENYKEKLKELT